MNIEQIIDRMRKNSLVKSIKINYKGEIMYLDPLKVQLATFCSAAILIATGIASTQLVNKVIDIKEDIFLTAEVHDEIGSYQDYIQRNFSHRTADNQHFWIDYGSLAEYITNEPELTDIKFKAYLATSLASREEYRNETLRCMAIIENMDYSDLDSFANSRGFTSFEVWNDNIKNIIVNQNINSQSNKKGM